MMLRNETCYLRAVDLADMEYIYQLENDSELWEVGNLLAPYSRFTIREYLENAHRDIYEVKQLRLAICTHSDQIAGLVDLYDFDPFHNRAGIGIVIDTPHRKKGLARAGLQLMIEYAFKHLRLHQLHASISTDNVASRMLFERLRFRESGIKKDWIATPDGYKDELIYQLINE
ncbi:GNAT family N-acetyltransferase [Nonlabens tegetincola]|nr:GNAT family N-acetyltransferase [Nonlabens tegetincola]